MMRSVEDQLRELSRGVEAILVESELKERLVGVPGALLARHGAVSEEVAHALAAGARERIGATYGIGITGVAGPTGGTEEKPVGTVHLALAGPTTGEGGASRLLVHRRVRFPGDRERVRWMSTQLALEVLRRHLLAADGGADGEGEDEGARGGADLRGYEAGVA